MPWIRPKMLTKDPQRTLDAVTALPLKDGYQTPDLGFGVFQISPEQTCLGGLDILQ